MDSLHLNHVFMRSGVVYILYLGLKDVLILRQVEMSVRQDSPGLRSLLSQAYTKYASQGFILGAAPGSPGFNQWQNDIFPICEQVPGACSSLLTSGVLVLQQIDFLTTPSRLSTLVVIYLKKFIRHILMIIRYQNSVPLL